MVKLYEHQFLKFQKSVDINKTVGSRPTSATLERKEFS